MTFYAPWLEGRPVDACGGGVGAARKVIRFICSFLHRMCSVAQDSLQSSATLWWYRFMFTGFQVKTCLRSQALS